MNIFKQHMPNFVAFDRPAPREFETTEDLLSLEIVQRYIEEDFSHFAMSDNILMTIHDGGFRWGVVGFIENPDEINLPEWEGGKHRVELKDGRRIILKKEVTACGGNSGEDLTLTDGQSAKTLSKKEWDSGLELSEKTYFTVFNKNDYNSNHLCLDCRSKDILNLAVPLKPEENKCVVCDCNLGETKIKEVMA